MTHAQYLEEPIEVVDWALAFEGMDARIESEATEAAMKKNKRPGG